MLKYLSAESGSAPPKKLIVEHQKPLFPGVKSVFSLLNFDKDSMVSRPLVATDAPGLSEVCKDGKNCLLVPPQDSKELAKAIITMLTHQELASELAQAGPESAKRFDMKLFVDYLEEEYQELVGKKRILEHAI